MVTYQMLLYKNIPNESHATLTIPGKKQIFFGISIFESIKQTHSSDGKVQIYDRIFDDQMHYLTFTCFSPLQDHFFHRWLVK